MSPDDDSKIMRRVVSDPVAAAERAREKYAAGEDNWRREKYEVLAVVYALGQYLKYHGSAWRRFIKGPFFADRKRPLRPIKDQPQAMRHAAYWVLNASNEAQRDRAAAYVRGLQVLARRGVRADDVVGEIIKAGGIEALVDAAKTDPLRPQKYRPPEEPEEKDYFIVTDDPDLHETDGEAEEAAHQSAPAQAKRKHEDRVIKAFERGSDPEGRATVEFEISAKRKGRLFAMVEGQQATVRIICRGKTDDGWVRFGIEKLNREKLVG
ncbi:hypothetical protein ACIQW5_27725 [Methylorubrum thiocyanatum]|uniref:hypothetical protein n=1 Tax=Methylorubrum thiocyanatum TaxID=47958 RepID=UPI003839FC7A